MKPSEKQEHYVHLFLLILPMLRNLETQSIWNRIKYRYWYDDVQLIHNLASCLVYPEFKDEDIYWLNGRARVFMLRARNDTPYYGAVKKTIREIYDIVPDDLRCKLIWKWPE